MLEISNRAMLASLNISQWSAVRKERAVEAEVAAAHGAERSMGRYQKLLVPKAALEPIVKAVSAARSFHLSRTLPWLDSGARILPAAEYQEYMGENAKLKAAFGRAVDAFVQAYPEHIEAARRALGSLFSERDYPRPEEVRALFKYEVAINPLPDKRDFRVMLDASEVAIIQTQIEARAREGVQSAMADLWQRAHDVTAAMVERLTATREGPNGEKLPAIFRDSLVENVRELVGLLPRLNVTGDARLDAIAREMGERLLVANAEELRASAPLRESVARDAAAILAQMESYTGGGVSLLAAE